MGGIAAFALLFSSWILPTTWLADRGYELEDPVEVVVVKGEVCDYYEAYGCYNRAGWLYGGVHYIEIADIERARADRCSMLTTMVHELVHAWQAEANLEGSETLAHKLHRQYAKDCFDAVNPEAAAKKAECRKSSSSLREHIKCLRQ